MRYITFFEAGRILNLSYFKLNKLIKAGLIRKVTIPDTAKAVIPEIDVLEYKAKLERELSRI